MGLLDRFRGRRIQKAIDPSMITVAAVNRSYANPGYTKYFSDRDPRRKAIATVSRYNSIYGIPRPGYDKSLVDQIAENVIYGMVEKRCIDYAGTTAITIEDAKGNTVDDALDWLKRPNPQDTFATLLKATIPDVLRSDAGCWVKTPDGTDHLAELRAYDGTEFWPELDRGFVPIPGEYGGRSYGVYSHGYVTQWWQHSGPGIYVPYAPSEVVYIRMYPRSNGPWGTCLLQRLRWHLECLDDGMKAAGMTFANGIMPTMEWNHGNMQGPEQLEEQRKDREEVNQGPENFGGIIDTFEGDTLKPLTPTMVDLEWLGGQKHISEIVWSYYGFPASEFMQGDVNRATAYIARNITKSSVLAPLLHTIEEMINCFVLPDLEGYRPDWVFSFVQEPDLDDELKGVQVLQGRQAVAMGYYQMGVPLGTCLKLAGVPEEDIEAVAAAGVGSGNDADLPGSTFAQPDGGPYAEGYDGTDDQQGHEGSDEGDDLSPHPRGPSGATVCPNCGHEWYSKATGDEITCPRCGKGMPRTVIRKGRREDMKPGEEWITMNGTHVLVKDGEIQSHEELKQKIGTLKRTPGTSAGAPKKDEDDKKELNKEATNSSNMEPKKPEGQAVIDTAMDTLANGLDTDRVEYDGDVSKERHTALIEERLSVEEELGRISAEVTNRLKSGADKVAGGLYAPDVSGFQDGAPTLRLFGDTYPIKDDLKAAGFTFDGRSRTWETDDVPAGMAYLKEHGHSFIPDTTTLSTVFGSVEIDALQKRYPDRKARIRAAEVGKILAYRDLLSVARHINTWDRGTE